MLSTERKLYILNCLEHEGTVQVKKIAEQLNISETTIRRDLIELSNEGKVNRVHGGAVRKNISTILTERSEVIMSDRLQMNFDIKSRVCKRACELIQDGECIFLDGGTSLVPMIDYLVNRPIKIVTHNHLLISKVKDPVAEIIVIGGDYNARYSMSCGPMAQNTLGLYNFDRAFIGCVGVDLVEKKAYTAEMETREIKKIAMKNSLHNYLIIDDSKLYVKGFCVIDSTEEFESIFCNSSKRIPEYLPDNLILVD
ncbi:DeoR/GlpR family DNA-binding transcription regulator [[Clostridium] innocuum]|nr:DeoR/GlpR family DNA-binding transcription regulator [[Clostridium] innocuum]MCR0443840.1 DeoR/GlpR family DNA-binding transcription regulator [[Clostridium] innocuum]